VSDAQGGVLLVVPEREENSSVARSSCQTQFQQNPSPDGFCIKRILEKGEAGWLARLGLVFGLANPETQYNGYHIL